VIETENFNRISQLGKLKFEPDTLRKEFYDYKAFNIPNQKNTSSMTILTLKNNLEKVLEIFRESTGDI
jgi:hypothetical protein